MDKSSIPSEAISCGKSKTKSRLFSEELRDEVLNLFLKSKKNPDPPHLSSATAEQRHHALDGTIESHRVAHLRDGFDKGLFDYDQPFTAFLKGLFDWSKRWNLDADWLLFRALKTVSSWSKYKVFRDNLQWASQLYGLDDPQGEPKPPEGFPAWNVFEDSRRVYIRKIEALATEGLQNHPILAQAEASQRKGLLDSLSVKANDYQTKVIQFYGKLGYKPVRMKELIKHIDWTVDFQVLGGTFIGIASSSRVEPQAVSKAVKSVLKVMGLNQRPTKVGHPLGTMRCSGIASSRKKGNAGTFCGRGWPFSSCG